jgi:hypothetical protein
VVTSQGPWKPAIQRIPYSFITDVHVVTNNWDDSDALHERIDCIKAKTPELELLFTDGDYGSEANDQKLAELQIEQVQASVRGRESAVDMVIAGNSGENYEVRFPCSPAKSGRRESE